MDRKIDPLTEIIAALVIFGVAILGSATFAYVGESKNPPQPNRVQLEREWRYQVQGPEYKHMYYKRSRGPSIEDMYR